MNTQKIAQYVYDNEWLAAERKLVFYQHQHCRCSFVQMHAASELAQTLLPQDWTRTQTPSRVSIAHTIKEGDTLAHINLVPPPTPKVYTPLNNFRAKSSRLEGGL